MAAFLINIKLQDSRTDSKEVDGSNEINVSCNNALRASKSMQVNSTNKNEP